MASVIALWLAIYAANHIDEVVSRRMLYHNSNVNLYEYTWLYALDRFCNITVTLVFYTALIAVTPYFLKEDNKAATEVA